MRVILLLCWVVQLIHCQIFESDLPVSLQPPPLQQAQPTSKDYGSFSADIQVAEIAQPPPPPQQQRPASASAAPTADTAVPTSKSIAHPTVLFAFEQESKLPPTLLNPFYKNPRIAEQLAKQSWFAPGENLVTGRQTDEITREKIFYMLKSAGLAKRKRRSTSYS